MVLVLEVTEECGFQEICIIREAQMEDHRVFILMTYGVEAYLVREKDP